MAADNISVRQLIAHAVSVVEHFEDRKNSYGILSFPSALESLVNMRTLQVERRK